MGVPMTAKEQLLRAAELGHELRLVTRGPWPELGDPHPKYYVSCSCGYQAAVRRSKKNANVAMAIHIARAIADGVDGLAPQQRRSAAAAAPLEPQVPGVVAS